MARTDAPIPESLGAHFGALLTNYSHVAPGRYSFESARSGLYAVLRERRPARIHVPHYTCSAVLSAVAAAGISPTFYSLDSGFRFEVDNFSPDDDVVLVVNYFGLCAEHVTHALTQFPRRAVIVDNAQAYFQAPFAALANIYSPRKFLPVPDGGYVVSDLHLAASEQPDEDASFRRYRYLLDRIGEQPEMSRPAYLEAEAAFTPPTLRSMSMISHRLAQSLDQDFIRRKRRENYEALSSLSTINKLSIAMGDQVPLCYPLMAEDGCELRRSLLARRIFCARYWPDAEPTNGFEEKLINNTVYLPIDHRYDANDMQYIVNTIAEWGGAS